MELQNPRIVNYALNNGDSINPQVLDTLANEARGGARVQSLKH